MIRKFGTVISWENGIALVNCDSKVDCSNCDAHISHRKCMPSGLLRTIPMISVSSKHPLVKGQRVQIGIAKGNLLSSAILVYLLPLIGFFLGTYVFQTLFVGDLVEVFGGTLGIVVSSLLSRSFLHRLAKIISWNPIILSVVASSNISHIEDLSSKDRHTS